MKKFTTVSIIAAATLALAACGGPKVDNTVVENDASLNLDAPTDLNTVDATGNVSDNATVVSDNATVDTTAPVANQ